MSALHTVAVAIAASSLAASALAGPLRLGGGPLLPPVGVGLGGVGLGGVVNHTVGTLDQTINQTVGPTVNQTLGSAINGVRDTVGRPSFPRALEKDANGFRVVRGEVLALSPSDASLAVARNLNFDIVRRSTLAALGLDIVVLRVPDGMSASEALAALRKADPAGSYDVDHIYNPAGGGDDEAPNPTTGKIGSNASIRVGMIDGGIDAHHDAFSGATIIAKGFAASGHPIPTPHGTAVASLLIGSDSDVTGSLVGASLYAADVYCGQAAGGSADSIAQALAWLAANDVPVVNISLAGPPNAILAAAVNAFVKRGHVLVAAVGNDGPAAGVEYPAGYPGVVGVTAVDGQHAVELEADRGSDVAFAALGVKVSAAIPNGGHASMTGTSFAAPVVASRFALLVPRSDVRSVAHAWSTLEQAALHLGPPGRNDIYGYGFLDRPSPLRSAAAAK